MPRRSVHPIWGSLSLERRASVSLQEQIVRFFRTAIAEGRLQGGRRVRSSRQFAADYGISRTTAVEAYERLVEEGYLVTRPGAGVFIAEVLPEDLRPKAAKSGAKGKPRGPRNSAAPDLGKIDMRHYQLPLAPGMPALDRFPWTAWMKLFNRICRERPLNALGYGDPQGELPLRETIAEYLATARGLICSPGQIVVMSGSEQIIAFAAGQVTTRGDTAWFENPGYPFLRHVLRGIGLNPVPVAVDANGLSVTDGLRHAADARLAMVSPTHQYPLGVSMSLERRLEVVDWSRKSGAWILENEIDGDYRYSSRPPATLYQLAEAERVIYCGSLSKPIAPGLRVNYLVAPESIVGSLNIRSTLVPLLTQLVLARFNSEGYLASHMNKMRGLYARRRALLIDALRTEAAGLLDISTLPEAGLRVTAGLLADVSDIEVVAECLKEGIRVDPLSQCYARDWRRYGLVMGFASTHEDQIRPSVRKLVGVLQRAVATAHPH
jgi:GntR family transcriptional regulator/MocR family aminotransferase